MKEVAKLLGLTGSELSSQLQSGKTLHSLAAEKGVSGNELIKTIETELSTHKPEGAPTLEPSQLTQIATSIANGTPPSGVGQIGHASSTQGESSTLAHKLGVEPSELLAQLEEGRELSSLVPSTGSTSDGRPRTAGSPSTATPSSGPGARSCVPAGGAQGPHYIARV
jgi:flagellar capping protein FliD